VIECPHEAHVVQAVLTGTWPDRCDEHLAAHAAHCEICGEVASVAAVLREDHEDARRHVAVPAAGQVWWRAAVRARLERAEAATTPITWLHGISGAIALGVMLAAVTMAWPTITAGFDWARVLVMALVTSGTGDAAGAVAGALRQSLTIALVAGALVLIAPIVLFFALSDD
jgi:hypothetical protein